MSKVLDTQTLEAIGTRFAVLGIGNYALLVRFRVRGSNVECAVPTWSGIADLWEASGEVTLVVMENAEADPRWLFLKGKGSITKGTDWEDIVPPQRGRVDPGDLYHLMRIEPRRMELFDEQRGWGFRETADFAGK